MRRFKSITALAALSAAGLWGGSQAAAQPELPQPSENAPPPGEAGRNVPDAAANLPEDYEVLARGPLHEAFASPYVSNPTPSEIVREQPPEPINEVPPREMPAGDGIVWISGYWGWEPAENAFVWISGLWREAPPNRRWVPGYWIEAEGGFQWVSGFWAEASESRIVYLPEPPPPQSSGPKMRPPSQDSVWLPGSWIWRDGDYEWRPGYWTPVAPGWVWVPDQYLWTPHGYIFVAGYWDRPLEQRGVMFAPVAYEQPIYTQPDYTYVPETVVNTTPLLMHLFASPAYSHYYYGDYYGFQPQGAAFFPWYTYNRRTAFYDPLLTYYQWRYATQGVNLVRRLSGWNGFFASNERFRPPRTFGAQRQFVSTIDADNSPVDVSSVVLTDTFQDVLRSNSTGVRFTQVADDRREFLRNASRGMRQFQQQRREFEQTVARQSGNEAANGQQPSTPDNQTDAQQENAFQLPDNPFRRANENPAVAGPGPAGDDDNPATAADTPANQEDPATADDEAAGNEDPAAAGDNNQPGQRSDGPPARPEPIQRDGQREEDDASAPDDEPGADRPNQPGASGAEDRTDNPATETDQPDSPNATDRPDAPNATARPDNPATPGANRPGAPESNEAGQNPDEAGQNEGSQFRRFGIAPRDDNTRNQPSTQNQPGAEQSGDTASPNGPGANRPGFVPQGRNPLRRNDPLNRLPPGMERGNVPGFGNPASQGQRPQTNPQMRRPNRGADPGAAQRAPRPQQPGTQAPNPATPQPRQRPNPPAPNPGAAGQGGNPAQPPAAAGGGGTNRGAAKINK